MTEIGRLFGVTGHQVGKWLKELDLRTECGNPSKEAYCHKLISAGYYQHGTYNKLWHTERVISLLEEAGHELIANPPPDLVEPRALIGPFTMRENSTDIWQLVGSDNEVAIVVTGRRNARLVQRVLNLAHQCGRLAV